MDDMLSLTLAERLMLVNQFRILAWLDDGNMEAYHRYVTILEEGFHAEYESIAESLIRPVLTVEQCTLVEDILQMYQALNDSYGILNRPMTIDVNRLRFPGFDGNNESRYLAYATFLHTSGRWQHVFQGAVQNSHQRLLGRYQEMLQAWTECGRSHELNQHQIETIIDPV